MLRAQRIDGKNLPEYDAVRRYFGPAGMTAVSEDDGWFLTGFTLSKEPPAAVAEAAAEKTAATTEPAASQAEATAEAIAEPAADDAAGSDETVADEATASDEPAAVEVATPRQKRPARFRSSAGDRRGLAP